ncbi:MAG: hypothetical protein J7M10_08485 [Candidatus Cloacimonetes bacterium]|nr:hypothetical protein [Candidatus Cloacimonadota bacterium]
MREIVLSIPTLEAQQNLEIEVRINGKKKTMCYRVELVEWDDPNASSEEVVDVLRKVIHDYDKDWELIQIGAPDKEKIPIMFRKKKIMYPDGTQEAIC